MRRSSVLVPLVALLTAACAGGNGPKASERSEAASSTSTTTAPPETTTTAGADPSSSSSSSSSATTATTRQRGTAPAPRTSGTSGTTVSPATTATTPPPPPTTATTARPVALTDVRVRLTKVATLEQPLALALRTGDDAFYVAEKRGRVRAVRGGEVAPSPVLDLSSEVSVGGEQGLLGIAFSPDGNLFYASYTNRDGDSRLFEYAFRDGKADTSTQRLVMSQDQPYANHNGGQIIFGPDGFLYYFLGDGGLGGDPHGNAQNLNTWLGKVLRIDPRPSAGQGWTVPPDNPFVGRVDAKPEIFSYGLRNPWRGSFDRLTGDLWIADVGQSTIEEVNFSPKDAARGANYGWDAFEGSKRSDVTTPVPASHVLPVHEYPTSDGCSVTGGYVYRGAAIPALQGAYVFSDFCNGDVQALRLVNGKAVEHRSLGVTADSIASFGEGPDGELYVLSLAGGFFRIDPA